MNIEEKHCKNCYLLLLQLLYLLLYFFSDIDVELESNRKRRELRKIYKLLILEGNLESASNSELAVDSVLSS